jgi:hypothetical protein
MFHENEVAVKGQTGYQDGQMRKKPFQNTTMLAEELPLHRQADFSALGW